MTSASTTDGPCPGASAGRRCASEQDPVEPREARVRGALRRTRKLTVPLAAAASAALALALVAPLAVGWRTFTVLSGSMEPAIAVGDAVVVKPIPAAQARVGEIITFADPDRPGRLLTHRVTRVRSQGPKLAFVTRGDANTGVERWSIDRRGSIGRVAYRVPKAGYLLSATRAPEGRIGLLVVPALLLGLLAVIRIWMPAGKDDRR